MSKRWAIANDPKLLARIAEQEKKRGGATAGPAGTSASKIGLGAGGRAKPEKKQPSSATSRAQKVAVINQDSRMDMVHFDEASTTLTIVLAGAELLSHNTALRMHDAKQSQLKTTWLKRIEALMILNKEVYDRWKGRTKKGFPLVVEEVYATGHAQCLDVEAVTAACKPIIDALVRTRFIPDDSREYIAQPVAYTYRQQPSGLVLVFRPAPKPWGVISDATMDIARGMPPLPS